MSDWQIVYSDSFRGSIEKVNCSSLLHWDEENPAHQLRDSIVRAERKKVLNSGSN